MKRDETYERFRSAYESNQFTMPKQTAPNTDAPAADAPEQAAGMKGAEKTRVIERFDGRRWAANVHGCRRFAYRTKLRLEQIAGEEACAQ